MKFEDLKLLSEEDAAKLVPIAKKEKKLIHINLTTIPMTHALFPRLAEIVPRGGDYGIFESSGTIVHFMGKLDSKKVNYVRMRDNPRKPRDESTKHYPGFHGGANRPTTEFRYIKVPGGHKHITNEPGMSSFVKKKYDVTFMLEGKKKKQSVWAKNDAEAIAMIKNFYPGAERLFKKNPRNAEILVDQKQLDMMIEAYKLGKVYARSIRERRKMNDLIYADLMIALHEADKIYNLTSRGKDLLIKYCKEQKYDL